MTSGNSAASRLAGIRAQIGYKRRPGQYGGKPSLAVDNTLDRRFDAEAPDKAWVTDITYIRTHEGFAYLAVVLDLFSRRVVGWSMQPRQTTNVVLQALLAAIWRRKPKGRVLVHSDQGSQFTSLEWASFVSAKGPPRSGSGADLRFFALFGVEGSADGNFYIYAYA